jgi:hypothetical protein
MAHTTSFTLEQGVVNVTDPSEVSGVTVDEIGKKLVYRALVSCSNIDIASSGKGSLRKGPTLVVAGNYRCGWSDGTQAYAMQGGNLVSFNGASVTVLQSGLSATADMVFEPGITMYRGGSSTINVVCFTNGEVYGMISAGRVVSCVASDEDFKHAMPPGQCLCAGGGRMYVGKGAAIYASEPFDMESRDERFDTVPFDKTVTMIRRADTGIYVSTLERVYWHPGLDLTQKDLTQAQAHYSPAIPGASLRIHSEKLGLKGVTGHVAVWAAEEGVCCGTDTGQIINISADRVSYAPGKKAALVLREYNGMTHFIVVMREPGTAKNKFTSRLFT